MVPVVQLGRSELGHAFARKQIERERQVEAVLASSLVYMVRHANAEWDKTGLQVFCVRRKRWKFWIEYQVRLAKVRLVPMASSGVSWVKGKGLIGRCWETRKPHFVDLDAHFAAHANVKQWDWDLLSSETRYGLTFEDFQRLRGKYGFVAAVPIIARNDKYLGCVTVDMPPGAAARLTDREAVLESLATAAGLVRELLA